MGNKKIKKNPATNIIEFFNATQVMFDKLFERVPIKPRRYVCLGLFYILLYVLFFYAVAFANGILQINRFVFLVPQYAKMAFIGCMIILLHFLVAAWAFAITFVHAKTYLAHLPKPSSNKLWQTTWLTMLVVLGFQMFLAGIPNYTLPIPGIPVFTYVFFLGFYSGIDTRPMFMDFSNDNLTMLSAYGLSMLFTLTWLRISKPILTLDRPIVIYGAFFIGAILAPLTFIMYFFLGVLFSFTGFSLF